MSRAFTLIELLIVVAIMGVMVAVGIVNVRAGQSGARVKGATRDIFAAIRHARSTALVTGQPSVITYSTVEEDGEVSAKLEIATAKLFDTSVDRSKVETLSGEPLEGKDEGRELVHIEDKSSKAGTNDTESASGGESLDEILFAPVDASLVKGMRVKVVMDGDEDAGAVGTTRRPNKISVFSNVDYLLERYKSARAAEEKKKVAETAPAESAEEEKKSGSLAKEEEQEPVSVVWETNGRVDPHRVWVYPDGKTPEDGLMIRIDRFGAAKVLSGDGREED